MMSTADNEAFLQRMQRVEALVGEIERSTDPAARAAQDLARELLDLHAAALARVVGLLSEAGEPGRAVLDACARDELVANVLLLHGLHPLDLETRVRQALDRVRPYLRGHGGDVELLGVSEGVVRLRMQGSCHGCASSAATLAQTIEQAIYDAAPDVSALEVEGAVEQPAPGGLVQLGLLPARGGAGP
jgi:Fe-S cluster biogenesis protein NfuA